MKKMQKCMIICGMILIATILIPGWLGNDPEYLEGMAVPFSMSECQDDLNATFQWQILNDSLYFTQVSQLNCASTTGILRLRLVQDGNELSLYEFHDRNIYAMCDCMVRINGTITGVTFENKVLNVVYVISGKETTLFEVDLV